MQNDEHDNNIDLDRVDLGSMGADSGSGVDAGVVWRLDNFWKSRVRGRQDMFINKLLNIYFLYITKHIFSYNDKYIPI